MNGTYRVEFVKGDSWPVKISITVGRKTVYLNITKYAGLELEEFLRNCSKIFFDSDSEQVPNGEIHFYRFSGSHDIEVFHTNGSSKRKFTGLTLNNDLAFQLAGDIYIVLYSKQPYTVREHGLVEVIPQQPVDQLAKAKRRVDANLKKFFGYS